MDLKKLSVGMKLMSNQEEINFDNLDDDNYVKTLLSIPDEKKKKLLEGSWTMEYDDSCVIIGGVGYPRTPDPDRVRRLIPPDKPIVLYCNTRYFLINSAKLQMVKDLTCIVGISQKLGKKLMEIAVEDRIQISKYEAVLRQEDEDKQDLNNIKDDYINNQE